MSKEPGNAPQQQAPTAPAGGTQQSNENDIAYWQKEAENNMQRYQGASKIISARDKEITDLKVQLEQVNQVTGEYEGRLTVLGVEHDAKVNTLTESLTSTQQSLSELEAKYNNASAELAKFNALKKYPDLLPLADTIPAVSDSEQMERIVQQYAEGLKEIVNQKTQQMVALAGIPPQPSIAQHKYSSQAEWENALKNAAGTDKFDDISDQFREWWGASQK